MSIKYGPYYMEHRLIDTWFLVDILWKLILTTEIVLIPEMIFQRQKMLFRQKIQSYGPDTNDFREFSIICKLNWERVWYFINNVLFNSKIVIFNQRTNRNEQNGTVHNSTSLIEHRYRIILLEHILISVNWKILHPCWWRMLETKCVGDNFKMLATVLTISFTKILYL